MSTEQQAARLLRTVKVAVVIAWAFVVGGVLVLAAPNNPLLPRAEHRNAMLRLMPQGWDFFTLNPHDPDLYLYRELAGGRLVPVDLQAYREFPLAAADRHGRLLSHELRTAALVFAPDVWTECRGRLEDCARSLPAQPIRLSKPLTYLAQCGRLLVESRPPTPWTWYRKHPDLRMPSRLIRLEAPCPTTP